MITLDRATVAYGPKTVLDDVSVTIGDSTSVAIIGPNGSGKTTLLNVIVGLIKPVSGTVTVDTEGATAYVLQHRNTRSWLPLTAGEVITMGCYRRRMVGRLSRSDRGRIADAATRLEVNDLLGRQYGELSGGQQQRVLLSQALVQEPSILLLDEPITGLDLASQQRILDLMAEETAKGTTVLTTTHNLDEARHCDVVLLMAGRLVKEGPPDDVLTAEHLRTAFGPRVLGDHDHHDHSLELLVVDDHGHGAHH